MSLDGETYKGGFSPPFFHWRAESDMTDLKRRMFLKQNWRLTMHPLKVIYYSDVLCIWAYAAQRRLEQLALDFSQSVIVETRFCSVFPDVATKVDRLWRAKGGYEAFGNHVRDVAKQFPHITVHPDIWTRVRPSTSASAHMYLKSVQLIETRDNGGNVLPYAERLSTKADHAIRKAFFENARDISDWNVHREISEGLGLDYGRIDDCIRSSDAVAALAADVEAAQEDGIKGSPTFLMNNGRQKLFGNVGYRLIEANVHELLRNPDPDAASWC